MFLANIVAGDLYWGPLGLRNPLASMIVIWRGHRRVAGTW